MALPGFRDFYPDDCAFRNAIFAKWREVAHRYGFVEYDGPPLEPLDLFTKKSGQEIVTQLYNFKDKGDRGPFPCLRNRQSVNKYPFDHSIARRRVMPHKDRLLKAFHIHIF